MATRIVLSTTHARVADIESDADIRAFRAAGVGPVELRLDLLDDLTEESLRRLVRAFAPDCIVTYRRGGERGPSAPATRASEAPEGQRLRFLEIAASEGAGHIDLEFACASALPRLRRTGPKTRVILSHHDFAGMPLDLPGLFRRIEGAGADIAKAAVTAKRTADSWEVFRCLRDRGGKDRIALCMGADGLPSRVLCAAFGAYLTYACPASGPQGGRSAAPGQIPWRAMADSYRVHRISERTGVYGVIGNPIAHSLSPAMQNAAIVARGLDAVYVPFRVEGGLEEVRAFLDLARQVPVRGFSVTLPHKESALACAKSGQPLASRIGAANTLTLAGDGAWAAANTDCGAAIGSLLAALGKGEPSDGPGSLKGQNVLLLGAGGAARALAFGLVDAGAGLYVCNRSHDRAEILAHELGAKAVPYSELGGLRCGVVVNTTSVGMHPNVEETPLESELLPSGGVVFDTIYTPAKTRLLREAEAKGNRVLNGVDMFVRQGAEQFAIWTNLTPPLDAMRRAVDEALRERSV